MSSSRDNKSLDDFPDVGTDRYFLLKGAGGNISTPLKKNSCTATIAENRARGAVEKKKQVLSTMQLLFLMLKILTQAITHQKLHSQPKYE